MKTIKLNTMKKLLLFSALIAVSFTTFAQVGIGTTTPNASAALDVTSTSQGLLPPRMTKIQLEAIDSPTEGLMVYCTDCVPKTLYVFDAFNFVSMSNNVPSGISSTDVYSITGKTWMDRNLGASQVATSITDPDSYGDLYQWGRNTDGHQNRTSTAIAGPVASGSEGDNFITSASNWLSTNDDTLWGVTKTANDPCPDGYRVPTEPELSGEIASIASVLKLPLGGSRDYSNGTLSSVGTNGLYWSSTVSGTNARRLYFNSTTANMVAYYRASGFSVRCIKE
jgi:hypothetical protein